MNQTVHTINLMMTIVGTPVEVFAYTACLAHERIEVEDTAVAVVKFASGALGIIHGTTAAYPGLDASLRVFGSKGSAVISDDELVFLHENAGEAPEIAMSEMTGRQPGHRRVPAGAGRPAAGPRAPPPARRLRRGRHHRPAAARRDRRGPHRAVGDPRDVRVRRVRPPRQGSGDQHRRSTPPRRPAGG